MDRRLLVIALILFVNALGSGLILPLLPFFATLAGPPLGKLRGHVWVFRAGTGRPGSDGPGAGRPR